MNLMFGLIEESGDLILKLAKTWCFFKRVFFNRSNFCKPSKITINKSPDHRKPMHGYHPEIIKRLIFKFFLEKNLINIVLIKKIKSDLIKNLF
jgi:hypothetical protein